METEVHSTNPKPVGRQWVYWGYWILVTALFLYDSRYLITKAGLPYFLVCTVVRIGLLIGIAWVNLHVLIPNYLFRKRYGLYIGFVLLLLVAYLVIQSLYDFFLFGFVLGPTRTGHLSAALLYNFTHTSLYLLLTVALKFSIDWYEQQKLLHEIRVEKLEAEVNYLRSQVNPHFLFNALNSLYALTLKKSDEAPEVVLKLSGLMEYMLYESNESYVPLWKEINYLRSYLELEKLRQGNQTDIQLEVTGDPGPCRIPPFLILPLVENAFKHGISKEAKNRYLRIQIKAEEELTVAVTNNKPNGRPKGQTGGIGLLNLKKRLELLYPDHHVLKIESTPNRYHVLLQIKTPC